MAASVGFIELNDGPAAMFPRGTADSGDDCG
jgi:hypothetical protein